MFVVLVLVVVFVWRKSAPSHTPDTEPPAARVSGEISNIITPAPAGVVVVPTGPERIAKATQSLAFTVKLLNDMPNQRAIKTHIASLAGILFFNDCLMAKITNGTIKGSASDLRATFITAMEQVYKNQLPPEAAQKLAAPPQVVDRHSLQAMFLADKQLHDHPEQAIVNGFDESLLDRNNARYSLSSVYEAMEHQPDAGKTVARLENILKDMGIQDAEQSDLKLMLLSFGGVRTVSYSMFGPTSDTSQPDELKAATDALDAVLHWRLVNMYGLPEAVAQKLLEKTRRMPVKGVSAAMLQPPAWIE